MTSPAPRKLTCKSCDGTGEWNPPGQKFKCLGCNGKGFYDMNAEYLRGDERGETIEVEKGK